MYVYKLINPSDAVTFTGDDDLVAAVAVMVFSNGKYGLKREGNDEVLPIFFFDGGIDWIKERIPNHEEWLEANRQKMGEFMATVSYGSIADREAYDKAVSLMDEKQANEYRAWHQDKRRTSMTDIGKAALAMAKEWMTPRMKSS